jgi:phosphatidylglycerol:prolipoprotein diacylglycerol transferase
MYPIFLNFGKIVVFSYGIFIWLSFVVSILYLLTSIDRFKITYISKNELFNLCVYIMFFGVIGSRLFFVVMNFDNFLLNPIDFFKFWEGGFVYYGGFLFGVIFLILYSKKKKIKIFDIFNFFSPGLALGHSIGRIGCFCAGCCYGKKTNVPWAIIFRNEKSLAIVGEYLHPTQLYEFICNFLLFLFLHFYYKKKHNTKKLFAIYFVCYSILRFIIDFFRGDFDKIKYFKLSISQISSIFLFFIGLYILCKKKLYIIKKKKVE